MNAKISALRETLAAVKASTDDTEESQALLSAAKIEFARGVIEALSDAPEPREIDARVTAVASVLPVLSRLERDLVVARLAKAWGLPKPALRARLTAPPPPKTASSVDEEGLEPAAEAPEWLKSLQARKDGTLRPNLHNLGTIFKHDEEAPQVQYDLLSQEIVWAAPPSWAASYDGCTTTAGDAWSNEDTTRLSSWLSREFRLDADPGSIERALDVRAREREIDSWRDHLDTLVWDGAPRLATAAETYYRATNGEAANLAYRYWVTQIAARAYEPGCKAHLVLVLHGGQGTFKSTSLEVLVGKRRFSDCDLDLESKEVAANLGGKIVHEFGEGTVLTRKDANSVKAFVSRAFERFTPKFKSKAVEVPRRTVFALTTNEDEMLTDSTGNRRFGVLEVGVVTPEDLENLKRDAEQLLAEAVALYKSGARWWAETAEEKALLAAAADTQRKRSPWEAEIEVGLSNANEVTIERVLEIVGLSSAKDVQQRHRLEAIGCLKALGWVRSAAQKRLDGRVTRYYERRNKIEVKVRAEISGEEIGELLREQDPPVSGIVPTPAANDTLGPGEMILRSAKVWRDSSLGGQVRIGGFGEDGKGLGAAVDEDRLGPLAGEEYPLDTAREVGDLVLVVDPSTKYVTVVRKAG